LWYRREEGEDAVSEEPKVRKSARLQYDRAVQETAYYDAVQKVKESSGFPFHCYAALDADRTAQPSCFHLGSLVLTRFPQSEGDHRRVQRPVLTTPKGGLTHELKTEYPMHDK
jgi:hypothetical protein